MRAIPVLVLFGATAVLGLVLGWEYLRRERSRPVMIGMHFLLGAAGLEVLVFLSHGTPDGVSIPQSTLGDAVLGLLALALFLGVLAPMVGRNSRPTMNVVLAAHATVAVAGVASLVVWVARYV